MTRAIERFLIDYRGGYIIVSHDRGSVLADFTGTAKLDYVLAPDDIAIESSGGTLVRRGDRFVFALDDVIDPPPVGIPGPGTAVLLGVSISFLLIRRGRSSARNVWRRIDCREALRI